MVSSILRRTTVLLHGRGVGVGIGVGVGTPGGRVGGGGAVAPGDVARKMIAAASRKSANSQPATATGSRNGFLRCRAIRPCRLRRWFRPRRGLGWFRL